MFDKKVPNRWTCIRMPPLLDGVSVTVDVAMETFLEPAPDEPVSLTWSGPAAML
jgi:hypothetical protein